MTPADVTLIESLDFSIKSGDHLLIAGPNGSGKSSLFRMLGGLWPVKEGVITIPHTDNMFYLPQRAYLVEGTLREQIIYPHALDQQKKTDNELKQILQVLKLDDYFDQLDSDKNWGEELSIGAQQRLAMARLYYHNLNLLCWMSVLLPSLLIWNSSCISMPRNWESLFCLLLIELRYGISINIY